MSGFSDPYYGKPSLSRSMIPRFHRPPRGPFDGHAPAILLDDASRGFQEFGVGCRTVLSSTTQLAAIFGEDFGGGAKVKNVSAPNSTP